VEILYVRESGKVVAVHEDGFAWGRKEAKDGFGIEPFGLLCRDFPLPDAPIDLLRVAGNQVEVVEPPDPGPTLEG